MMDTKKCCRCSEEKPVAAFTKKNTTQDGLSPSCRECTRKGGRRTYQKYRNRRAGEIHSRVSNLRKWVWDLKSSRRCKKCGESHPACLEFHHTNRQEKDSEISKLVGRGAAKQRLWKEIQRCDILCANCHRKHHYEEKMSPPTDGSSSTKAANLVRVQTVTPDMAT